jgi:hypothetical protein
MTKSSSNEEKIHLVAFAEKWTTVGFGSLARHACDIFSYNPEIKRLNSCDHDEEYFLLH